MNDDVVVCREAAQAEPQVLVARAHDASVPGTGDSVTGCLRRSKHGLVRRVRKNALRLQPRDVIERSSVVVGPVPLSRRS